MNDQKRDKKTGIRPTKSVPRNIVIDGAYLRGQARDAMLTFIAPLNGVYAAATGARPANAANEISEQKKKA